MPVLRLSRLVLRTAISILLLIAVLWASAAVWIDGPESRALAGVLAACGASEAASPGSGSEAGAPSTVGGVGTLPETVPASSARNATITPATIALLRRVNLCSWYRLVCGLARIGSSARKR